MDTMHFHRQFCVDPTHGIWFRSQTWILDQIFSSVQKIAIQILTKYHRGIMLPKEQQYGRLPDKFWPQIIADSCFWERNSTEDCQTNTDHRLPRIHAFERCTVQINPDHKLSSICAYMRATVLKRLPDNPLMSNYPSVIAHLYFGKSGIHIL